MPIKVEYLETAIILAHYRGVVTLDEIRAATQDTRALATQHGVSRYFAIIEASELKSVPNDPQGIGTLIQELSDCEGYLMVNFVI